MALNAVIEQPEPVRVNVPNVMPVTDSLKVTTILVEVVVV